jgi:tetratricopeptide (TPR) repeat protein
MYYEFRQYASAVLVTKDALKYSANNQMLLQIAAESFDELGAEEQSMQMYQRLYNVTDDAFILYEVANKQYELKMYQDALINTELLLGKPMVSETMVKVGNSGEDEIPILFKAVVFNLQGLIAKGQGKDEDAKKYFNNALKIAPNYALAKENLNPSN